MSKSRGSSSSNVTVPPELLAEYQRNLAEARTTAANLPMQQFADFTPDYRAGENLARNTILGGQGLNTLGSGVSLAQQAGGYGPETVSGGSFLNANVGAYMNPFLQNVAGNVMSDLGRARQMEQMQTAGAAAKAGAFGGSRQGVLEAETNRNFYDRLGNTLSNLYASGFDTAAGLAGQDLNRALQAAGANQAAGLTANQQRMAAATLLGELGGQQQQMGLQGANALVNLGLAQQEMDQARLDAARNLMLEQERIRSAATGLYPPTGQTSSGSTRSFSLFG